MAKSFPKGVFKFLEGEGEFDENGIYGSPSSIDYTCNRTAALRLIETLSRQLQDPHAEKIELTLFGDIEKVESIKNAEK